METTTLQRSGEVYTDIHGLQNLKRGAAEGSEESLRAVARQFESMLVNMMMKSMRDANAVFEEGSMFQSQENQFYRDMYDQQMSLTLAQQGGVGLADVLVRQLSKQLPETAQAASALRSGKAGGPAAGPVSVSPIRDQRVGPNSSGHATDRAAGPNSSGQSPDRVVGPASAGELPAGELPAGELPAGELPADATGPGARPAPAQQKEQAEQSGQGFLPEALRRIDQLVSAAGSFRSPVDFVARLLPLAEHAAEKLGANPKALLAQAALETGWGKHVIGGADEGSFNLFNIKADSRWSGDSASVSTLEFRDGIAERVRDRFRSYGSYAESFMDYVRFLQGNPRYQQALEQAGDADAFVSALHEAGYATDPDYSSKVRRIMHSEVFDQALEAVKAGAELPISMQKGFR